MTISTDNAVHDEVRKRYGAIARSHSTSSANSEPETPPAKESCCGSGCCGGAADDEISRDLYSTDEKIVVPREAIEASLGCGNPTALIDLQPGEVVLDLGSGGGIDVLLSARRVGQTGRAFGLDMTDDMLALARANQARAGVSNVEFLKGQIEAIPLPDASVDVVISNCVINLSPDKDAVLREAFRVLKPGGRFAVSDVVRRGHVPDDVRKSMELWVGCIAGALEEGDYASKLESAGFEDVGIEPWRVYDTAGARTIFAETGIDPVQAAEAADGRFASAFVRARKPQARTAPEA